MYDSAVWSWWACPSKTQFKSSATKKLAVRRLVVQQLLLASPTVFITTNVEIHQLGQVGQSACHALSASIFNIIAGEFERP